MKHYLLNHQPQKGLQAACAQQGQAPTCNARGKGRTSASPATLTKVILVLLTTLLLPSAACGQGTITVAGNAPESDGTFKDKNSGETISGVRFDESTSTLTLNGATITGSIVKTAIKAGDQLIINLVETNTVNGQILFQSTDRSYPGDLTFTGSGSLIISDNNSVFDGVSTVNTSESLYIATDSPAPHCYNGYYVSSNSDDTSVKSLTVSSSVTYPIWVYNTSTTHCTQLTETASTFTTPTENVDENHSGSVSFNGTTLTLNNFVCNNTANNNSYYVFYIGEEQKALTVNLIGTNKLLHYGFNYANLDDQAEKPTLTYTTSDNGGLEFDAEPVYSESVTVNYGNGLNYDISTWKIWKDWPRLQIGDSYVRGTVSSVDGYSNIKYNDDTHTLTLSGTTIGESGTTNRDVAVYIKDLTVEISGTNIIYGRFWGQYEENDTKGTIFFKKASDAPENTSLTISGDGEESGPIFDFSKCTWGEGLYLTEAKKDETPLNGVYYNGGHFNDATDTNVPDYVLISNQPTSVSLWIGNKPVTTDNASNVFEGDENLDGKVSVTFGDTNILTLNGAMLEENIISSLPNLTIKLAGENNYNNLNKDIISTNPSATLTFTTDGNNSLYLNLSENLPWRGFAGNPTFENKLVLCENSDVIFLKVLQAPTMSYSSGNNSSGNLTFGGLSDGYIINAFDCYYTITYEDGDGSNSGPIKYEPGEGDQPNPVTMAEKPCTVTAYVTYKDRLNNTTQSETAIGKYFGIADKTIVFNNDTKGSELKIDDLEIIPATKDEGVSFSFRGVNNSDIIMPSQEGNGYKYSIAGIGICEVDMEISVANPTIQVLNPFEGSVSEVKYAKGVVTVLPDKPSIVKDTEHEYIETDKITINRTTVEGEVAENIKIFYTWSDDVKVETNLQYIDGGSVSIYSEPIAAQTGTLRAWVGYLEGDNYYYNSEVVSEEFTVYEVAEMEWESETQTYGTLYNPDKDMAVPTGSTAYIVTGISEDGTKVTISPVSYIKAGVAVLIERNKTTEVSKTTDFSASKMNYSNPNTPAQPSATDNWYVIYNNKFVKVTTGTEVSGGKCYLNLNGTSSAGTRGYYDIDGSDGTTGIREVKSEGVKGEKLADGAWHDLQGRKFTTKPTKPGLYILNGKKVVIK